MARICGDVDLLLSGVRTAAEGVNGEPVLQREYGEHCRGADVGVNELLTFLRGGVMTIRGV